MKNERKDSNQLFLELNQSLHKVNRGETLIKEDLILIARQVCNAVAKTFQAFEVSLFLNNPWDISSDYELVATTWPHEKENLFTTRIYHALEEEGLTGWILARKQPIRVFDLTHFESERKYLQPLYPGLNWSNPLHLEEHVREFLKIDEKEKLPPLSYTAAPVLVEGRVWGVIRCCTIREPYFFTDKDTEILRLVADHIGQAWSSWLRQHEIKEENDFWQRFVQNVTSLNQLMQEQLNKKAPNESEIFQNILRGLKNVITNAEILDIALYDKEKHQLYFAEVDGEAWNQGDRFCQKQTIPVDNPPTSGSAYIWKTNKACTFEDSKDPNYYPDKIFPKACSIIAPISVAGEKFGILHIRRVKSRRPFPKNAEPVAVLLGQKLGLYLYSVSIIRKLDDLTKEQAQTYEDFAHELKSPIFQLHARTREFAGSDSSSQSFMALRGLATKARNVIQSFKLFANLTHRKPIKPKLTTITYDYLIKALIEAVIDQRSIIDPRRGLHIKVDRDQINEAFEKLRDQRGYVEMDKDLFFQALNNLIDNAAKYSYKKTTVDIFGGLMNKGRNFHISVKNRGLPITKYESDFKCRERGWRSEDAKRVTGEGSGIGLWIVHHIMLAHSGELRIIPTTPDHETEVKLIFPVKS